MDKENFCHVNESTLAELSQAKWTLDGMRKNILIYARPKCSADV